MIGRLVAIIVGVGAVYALLQPDAPRQLAALTGLAPAPEGSEASETGGTDTGGVVETETPPEPEDTDVALIEPAPAAPDPDVDAGPAEPTDDATAPPADTPDPDAPDAPAAEEPADVADDASAPPEETAAGAEVEDPFGFFAYHPPGDLRIGSGNGRLGDRWLYLPRDIALPMDLPFYPNSQVYNTGGFLGPDGGQCDPANYAMVRDNFCEERSWSMPLCPGGAGHQGVDIRPSTCAAGVHPVYAVADGVITRVTRNTTVELRADDGTRYRYLHMDPVEVETGQTVVAGERVGFVSNIMGGEPGTTIHLHFDATQTIFVESIGEYRRVHVPEYASLVAAIRRELDMADLVAGNMLTRDAARERTDADVGIAASPAAPEPVEGSDSGP